MKKIIKHMKVVLIQDVPGFGKTGDLKDVKPGYARNFLFIKDLATLPDDKRAQNIVSEINSKRETSGRAQSELEEKISNLAGKKFVFKVKVNQKGIPFRSIQPKDIAEKLGINEDLVSKNILKTIGTHEITINYKNISVKLTVILEKE